MNQLITTGIILRRTDYGEADRIITVLTPDRGKLHLLAKGVRKVKSKLAGGIELFSVSSITYLPGRKELGTLVSTRLSKHYGHIVKDIDRTMLGYELIKQLDSVTEDEPEPEYFTLLEQTFAALNEAINPELIRTWFAAQLLSLTGHSPNLQTDTVGHKLAAEQPYNFNYDDMAFAPHPEGQFGASDIKFLRLLFSGNSPQALQKIEQLDTLLQQLSPLLATQAKLYLSR